MTDPKVFVKEIADTIRDGNCIVPFYGSGISAPSGILMGKEFDQYLAYVVWKIIGEDDAPLDLRRDGWPEPPGNNAKNDAIDELKKLYHNIVETFYEPKLPTSGTREGAWKNFWTSDRSDLREGHSRYRRPLAPYCLFPERDFGAYASEVELSKERETMGIPSGDFSPSKPRGLQKYIEEFALCSLWHWTTTLEFLATVAVNPNYKDDSSLNRLYIAEREAHIIDSFNAFITEGRKPNLIHNMLARLARSMGTQIFLTTNFDRLLEMAFGHLNEAITSFSVSINGGLPGFDAVRSQTSEVKLHGTLSETRADATINSPPSDKDKQTFFSYLSGPKRPYETQPDDFRQSRLLVLGYSASDARCVEMMKYVLDHNRGFEIFWVCYDSRDYERVSGLFTEYEDAANVRIHFTITPRVDLLLWELYQAVNFSLPGGGFTFQYTHSLPPTPRQEGGNNLIKEARGLLEEIEIPEQLHNDLGGKIGKKGKYKKNFPVKFAIASGVNAPMHSVFSIVQKAGKQAIWLELEEYANAIHMLFHLLQVIVIRTGRFQRDWINVFRSDWSRDWDTIQKTKTEEARAHFERLFQYFGVLPADYVLFLYGRNAPGSSAGMGKEEQIWVDDCSKDLDSLTFGKHFAEFLAELGFSVIHMPYSKERHRRNIEKGRDFLLPLLADWNLADGTTPKRKKGIYDLMLLKPFQSAFPDDDVTPPRRGSIGAPKESYELLIREVMQGFLKVGIIEKADENLELDWQHHNNHDRLIWLYGLTLFRQARHSSAMTSDAVLPAKDPFTVQSAFRSELQDFDQERWDKVFNGENPSILDVAKETGWIEYLASKGLFLAKPGGYSWKYRDSRIGLLEILESYKRPVVMNDLSFGLQSFRPRLHYKIGLWYFRAYHSTGHFAPLVETFYHYCNAFLRSTDYEQPVATNLKKEGKPDESKLIVGGRVRLAVRALIGMRTVLMVAPTCFRYWCPGIDLGRTSFKGIEDLKAYASEGDNAKLRQFVEKLIPTRGGKATKIEVVAQENVYGYLSGQLRSLIVAYEKLVAVVSLETSPSPPRPIGEGATRPLSATDSRSEIYENLPTRADVCEGNASTLYKMITESFFGEGSEHQVRIKERKIFLKEIFSSKGTVEKLRTARRHYIWNWVSDQFTKDETFASPRVSRELARVASDTLEVCYLLVRKAKYEDHRRGYPFRFFDDDEPSDHSLWAKACVACDAILDICRYVSVDHLAEVHTFRIRALTLYGLCLGRCGRFREAHRRLNEAHALIGRTRGLWDSDELAKVHLRRCEVDLLEAQNSFWSIDASAEQAEKNSTRRQFVGKIDNAWANIERAEVVLSGVSHSSLWWSRLSNLKLLSYATLGYWKEFASKRGWSEHHEFGRSSLPFRKRIEYPHVISRLCERIDLLSDSCTYTRLRTVHYVLAARSLLRSEAELKTLTESLDRAFAIEPQSKDQACLNECEVTRHIEFGLYGDFINPAIAAAFKDDLRCELHKTLRIMANLCERSPSAADSTVDG